MALFPFAGIVARRFKQYDINVFYIDKIFNSFSGGVLFLIVLYFLCIRISYYVVYGYVSYVVYGYVPLIVIPFLCYKLGNMEKLKDIYKKNEQQSFKYRLFKACAALVILGCAIVVSRLGVGTRSAIIGLILLLTGLVGLVKYVRWSWLFLLVICGIDIFSRFEYYLNDFFRYMLYTGSEFLFGVCCIVFLLLIFAIRYLFRKISWTGIYFVLGIWMVVLPIAAWGNVVIAFKDFYDNCKYFYTSRHMIESIRDRQLNALTIPVLKTLVQQEMDKNYLISVHNLYQGLSILANGAEGETLEKLKKLLGSSALQNINDKSNEVIKRHSNAFSFDNQVFVEEKYLDKSFRGTLNKYFDISVQAPKARCRIDIESTLRFSSLWKDGFGGENIYFYTPKEEYRTPGFWGKITGNVAYGDGFSVLVLPYKSGDVLYIILPDEVEGKPKGDSEVLKNVVAKLDADTLRSLHFKRRKLKVEVPEFTITDKVLFKPFLDKFGLGNLFKEKHAELKKVLSPTDLDDPLCDAEMLYVDKFEQKNEVIVSKDGTMAESIQEIGMSAFVGISVEKPGPIYYPFIVDRPFIFMVNDGAFVGIVYDPRKK